LKFVDDDVVWVVEKSRECDECVVERFDVVERQTHETVA